MYICMDGSWQLRHRYYVGEIGNSNLIMVFCPLYFLKEITEVSLDWNKMFPRCEGAVEVLIVGRVCLEHQRPSCQEERHAICSNRSIQVHLVFVVKEVKEAHIGMPAQLFFLITEKEECSD